MALGVKKNASANNETSAFSISRFLKKSTTPHNYIAYSKAVHAYEEFYSSSPGGINAPLYQRPPKISFLSLAYIRDPADFNTKVELPKRIFDIIFSIIVITLGFPVFLSLYLITLFSSKGPAIFTQERIGRNGRPFNIYKFRSMYINAEERGPQLSSEQDPRITGWGRYMRRTRLDELPQFLNVLKGDMSVVGPRPERQYFINQIIQKNPAYSYLHCLKPGVTSMGQVYFGYAESVDEMCSRMLYDLEYLKHLSLQTDIWVIIKTIQVMLQCKGK